MLSTNQTIGSLRNCEELYFDFPFDTFYSSVPVKTVQKHLMVVELRPVAVFVLLLSLHFRLLSRSTDLSVTLSCLHVELCVAVLNSHLRCLPPMKAFHKALTECFLFIYFFFFKSNKVSLSRRLFVF